MSLPYVQMAVLATAVKLLLVPTYRSTDFEVHRNWLAITHSLPLSQWYTEATSEWTLDYPPLFAWFEWALSQAAALVDPAMLVITNLNYGSPATVLFQRCSVMATDLVLIGAAYAMCKRTKPQAASAALFFLIVCNAGLLLVDHVHFQYNGVLLGVLLWSLHAMQQGRDLSGGVLFAVLLNMKHLFAYAGPAYFVFILRAYCTGRAALLRFLAMGAAVAAVCAASLGPWVAMDQLPQVLGRLFPFGRGLCHAYWAANFWALYSFADKVLAAALPRFGVAVDRTAANMAGGVVGVAKFAVLPQAGPRATLALVLLVLLPCLVSLWRRPLRSAFARAVAYSLLCGFVFGYHVHEKAIITVLIPLAVDALASPARAGRWLVLAAAGHYGLLPLLFRPQEYLPKIALVLVFQLTASVALHRVHLGRAAAAKDVDSSAAAVVAPGAQLLTALQRLYLAGFLPLELYCSWGHGLLFQERLPFLPLMATSVYCAAGVAWVWLHMALEWLR